MSISRRQLEAFGETLGDNVTRREGGRVIYGGGGSSAPASTTQVSDLPDWAKPYAKDTLGQAAALTDVNQNPYQTYGGQRIADFSGLQKQAQAGAANLAPSQQTGMAGQFAGAATMGALGTQYNPYQTGQFGGQTAASYMNPYMQNVVDAQQREAIRASDIQRNQQQAQAVGQGAFGGSRQAIVEAERQRNLGTQLGDIQAKGLSDAYTQAQQQFNAEQQLREQSRQYGAGLGLQGMQTALTGAGQLANIGQQQFGQQQDVINLQNQIGAQQTAQQQNILSQQYQDFLNQQKYPYQQLEFMSNILRGTPMGTVQTLYGAQPTLASQALGAGTSLAGAYMMGGGQFAEGGEVGAPAGLADLALSKM